MSLNDPIADMLTRIRNAVRVNHKDVTMPSSKVKVAIANVLKEEGYIQRYAVVSCPSYDLLKIFLKYGPNGEVVFTKLERISKGGRRVYCSRRSIPRVIRDLGIAIISTSQGVMSNRECRKRKIGGEVMAYVY